MIIAHLIVGLGDGGAERTLFKIVTGDNSNKHHVISLTDGGRYGGLLRESGIATYYVRWKKWNPLASAFLLVKYVKQISPDLVHAWMPHASLLVTLLSRAMGVSRIVWSIRASDYGSGIQSWPTRIFVNVLAALSHGRFPSAVIVVGHRARKSHIGMGFYAPKMRVIQNGYEMEESDPKSLNFLVGADFRDDQSQSLNLGMLARYDSQKDHLGLLLAFREVRRNGHNVTLKLAGSRVNPQNSALRKVIEDLGLSDCVELLGRFDDPRDFYKQIDIHVLSSKYGEGFPNVVAESMKFGLPNVVTDVGDAADIVGNTGWVSERGDPAQLADRLSQALSTPQAELESLGKRASERINSLFPIREMIDKHLEVYNLRELAVFPRYSELGASSRVRMYMFGDALMASGWSVRFFPFSGNKYVSQIYTGKRSLLSVAISTARRIFDSYRARGADVIWVEKELLPLAPWPIEERLLSMLPPVVYDFDDAIHEHYSEHGNRLVRLLLSKKTSSLAKRAPAISAGNTYLNDYFTDQGQTSVYLVPSVIDTHEIFPNPDLSLPRSGRFVFGWIGTEVTYRAYLKPQLQEFSRIAIDLDADFWVIGPLKDEDSSSNVYFLPWKKSSENQLLNSLDVGLMPLRDDPWSRGKCGYKILQYMAAGKPTIATPVGANKEIIRQGVNGFLADTLQDWETFLHQLAENPGLRKQIGEAGRSSVKQSFSKSLYAPIIGEMLTDQSIR